MFDGAGHAAAGTGRHSNHLVDRKGIATGVAGLDRCTESRSHDFLTDVRYFDVDCAGLLVDDLECIFMDLQDETNVL